MITLNDNGNWGRLGNQIFRSIPISILVKKHNLKVKYPAKYLQTIALKGMGNLLNHFDYLYLEVNKNYLYKDCALVGEIDEYLKSFNFKRVETSWTNAEWGDALYIKQ